MINFKNANPPKNKMVKPMANKLKYLSMKSRMGLPNFWINPATK